LTPIYNKETPNRKLFMITIQAFRKSLGKVGKNLSEQELANLLNFQYRLSNVLFDIWKDKHQSDIQIAAKVVVRTKDGHAASVEFYGEFNLAPAYAY